MKKSLVLFAIFGTVGLLASCGENDCCTWATNTYDNYDSFINDFAKQEAAKGKAFYFLKMEDVIDKEYVSKPTYVLTGLDACDPSSNKQCKKDNGHSLNQPFSASYRDTVTIEPGKEWDSPYITSDLKINIDFMETNGEILEGPSAKIPSSVEWETVMEKDNMVKRSYKYGEYLNADFEYVTIGQLNPTDDERYLVNKIGGIVEDIKNTIKNALLAKYGE